ncbi:MAG: GGDEF domain-containing protein [Kineosporiaceae bacterium]
MHESPAEPLPGPPPDPLSRGMSPAAVTWLLAGGVAGLVLVVAGVFWTGRVWPALPALLAVPLAAQLPPARALRLWRVTAVVGVSVSLAVALAFARDVLHDAPAFAVWLLTLLGVTELTLALQTQTAHLRARVRAEAQARAAMAVRDALTDVTNRSGLDMVAAPMIENARRKGEAVHALYLDLDEFHTVNETLGSAAGDEVLVSFAAALLGATRSTDVVGRWSGDEFVVIGPGVGSSPLEMERRLRTRLESGPAVPVEVWQPRVSIGSATLVPWDDGNLESLLQRAEQDMNLRRSLRRQQSLPRRSAPESGEPPVGRPDPRSPGSGFDALRPGPAPTERRRPGRDVRHPEPPEL